MLAAFACSFTLMSQNRPSLTAGDSAVHNRQQEIADWVWPKSDLRRQVQPKNALISSFIIPGLGQFKNRQYAKIPIIYAAIGGLFYAIDYNNKNYKLYNEAYGLKLEGIEPPNFPTGIPALSYKNQRDAFDKNLQLSYIGLFAVYILNAADAFVSAHLLDFDSSDDLSFQMKLQPATIPLLQPTPSVSLMFAF